MVVIQNILVFESALEQVVSSQLLVLVTRQVSLEHSLSREAESFKLDKQSDHVSRSLDSCTYTLNGGPLFWGNTDNLRTRRKLSALSVLVFKLNTQHLRKQLRALREYLRKLRVLGCKLLEQCLGVVRIGHHLLAQLPDLGVIAQSVDVDLLAARTSDDVGTGSRAPACLLLLLSELGGAQR